jgi:hypothetical protein
MLMVLAAVDEYSAPELVSATASARMTTARTPVAAISHIGGRDVCAVGDTTVRGETPGMAFTAVSPKRGCARWAAGVS